LISFAGIEALTNFVDAEAATLVVEEIGEMAGVTLVLWGPWELAGSFTRPGISAVAERNLRVPSGRLQAGEGSSSS